MMLWPSIRGEKYALYINNNVWTTGGGLILLQTYLSNIITYIQSYNIIYRYIQEHF